MDRRGLLTGLQLAILEISVMSKYSSTKTNEDLSRDE